MKRNRAVCQLAAVIALLIGWQPARAQEKPYSRECYYRTPCFHVDSLSAAVAKGDVKGLDSYYHLAIASVWNKDSVLRPDMAYNKYKEKLIQAEKKLAKLAGGHSIEVLGDGTRVSKCNSDALEAAVEALGACKRAEGTAFTRTADNLVNLNKAYAEYESKLARASKIDKTCLRYYGDTSAGSQTDIAGSIIMCEYKTADRRMLFEDTLSTEQGSNATSEGCGFEAFDVRALKIGGAKFGAFELDGSPINNAFAVDCKKMPRKSKLPPEIKKVLKTIFPGLRADSVVVMNGGFNFRERGVQVWKVAQVHIYNKKTRLKMSGCGEADRNIVCEAAGSKTVKGYNLLAHYLKRAAIHKAAGRGARCKSILKLAYKAATEWEEFYRNAKSSGSWAAGLRYKTREDGILGEDAIVKKVQVMGKQADERALGGWCGPDAAP